MWHSVSLVRPITKLLDTPLKLVGAATAVISLILAGNEVAKVLSDARERRRHVEELQRVAVEQQKSGDYAAAWASLAEASKIDDRAVRISQEDLAMAWLRDVRISEGSKFSDIVDPLAVVLTRGTVSASGVRKADLLAHVGWAHFLKSRDGSTTARPEDSYREAIEIDSGNPFAHVYWGHWIMWMRGNVDEATRHFAAAVASGRERPYVRQIQLAALNLFRSDGADVALLRAVDEMRRNGEPIDARTRRGIYDLYYSSFSSDSDLRRLIESLPPREHIATIRALFFDRDFEAYKAPLRDAMLAMLQEAAGSRDEALATWRAVRAEVRPDADRRVTGRADAAIARLSR